jgi:hypothetical protein
MKRYQPSNIAPTQGKQLLAISSVVTGVVVGGAVAFISQWLYLIVLFPILMGFSGGAAIAWAVKKGKVRNPIVASAFAALSGLILYATMNYGQYLLFLGEATKIIQKELPQSDRASIDQIIEDELKASTGSGGFVGYLKLSAQKGIDITRAGRSSKSGIHLDQTFTLIYWLIEFAVIEGLAIAAASAAASSPFSEDANDWYDSPQFVGTVESTMKDELLTLVNNEHFGKLGSLLNPAGDVPHPRIDVNIQSAAAATTSDSILFIYLATKDKKGDFSFKELNAGLITPLQKADLFRAIEEKKAAQELEAKPVEEKDE